MVSAAKCLLMSQWEMGSMAVWPSAVLLWDHGKVKSSCNDKWLFTWVNKVSDRIPSQIVIFSTCRGFKLWSAPATSFLTFEFSDYLTHWEVNTSYALGLLRDSKHCKPYETSLLAVWNGICSRLIALEVNVRSCPSEDSDNMMNTYSSPVCFIMAWGS